MIAASERERHSAISTDRVAACIAVLACVAAIAGFGIFGDALLYFYVAYGVGTLGVLVLLLVTLSSDDLRVDGVPMPLRVAAVCAVALAARAFLFYHGPLLSFDLNWYGDYVKFLQMHFQPYGAQFFFPYPQGFLDFLLPFAYAANPQAAIHWALIAIDCAVAAGVMFMVRRMADASAGFWCGLAYALMPMAVLEVGRIGHFETLVNACFVVLLTALHKRRPFAAALAIAAGVCLKVFPIVVAPAIFRTWKSKRSVAYSAAGAVLALVVSALPVIGNLHGVLAFWLGGSSSSPLAAGTFVANSLPALAADVPSATPLVAAAQAAALLAFVLLAAYAIRSAGNGARDGRPGIARLNLRAVSVSGYRFSIILPSTARFAIALFLAALFVYGCYLIGKPWAPSQYAYTWWYPTPLLVGLGTALASLSAIGMYALTRDETALVPAQTLAATMAAVLGFVILLRASVNPWYLMPMLVLLLGLAPARFAVIALGCVLTFYASYNSTSFSSLGWNDVITTPASWSVHRGEEPGRIVDATAVRASGAFDYLIANSSGAKSRFLVLSYGACAPRTADFVIASAHRAIPFTRPVVFGAAAVPLPADLRGELRLRIHKTGCAPAVRVVRAAPAPASVAANGNTLVIRIPEPRSNGGWPRSVSASSAVFAWAYPNTALAMDVVGDSDPTFHHWPFAFSVFVRGTTVYRHRTGWIPIHDGDTSATDIGAIRYRIPLFNLPAHLNTVEGIRISVRTLEHGGGEHTLRINDVRVVNEARWGVWTQQATALVVLAIGLAAAVIYVFAIRSLRRSMQ